MVRATPMATNRGTHRGYRFWRTRWRPGSRGRSAHRTAADRPEGPIPGNALHFLLVTELTERAVASRVPSLADEKLRVIARRDPVTVREGTSLGECIDRIRETGTGDSVFVTDADGVLCGVLTERDIFSRLVGHDVDLDH